MGRGAPQGRRSGGATRGYDRTDRLNELLVRILADEVERIDDDRLGFLTVAGVETDRDLSMARVYVPLTSTTTGFWRPWPSTGRGSNGPSDPRPGFDVSHR